MDEITKWKIGFIVFDVVVFALVISFATFQNQPVKLRPR